MFFIGSILRGNDRFSRALSGVDYVAHAEDLSLKVTDVTKACATSANRELVGIRLGAKFHEQMIGTVDAPCAYEYIEHYKVLPGANSWHLDPHTYKVED